MMAPRSSLRRALAVLASLALLGIAPSVRAAPPSCIDKDNLLPAEAAFELQAQALGPDRIALNWKIAPGCYLYRHQIRVKNDAGFDAQPLQLPAGEAHEDQYFGRVETYRGALTAQLPGQAQGARATLKVRYQGCADAGICYPPQTRNVVVELPAAVAAPALTGFGARNALSSGVPLGGGLLHPSAAGQVDALPLPPEQAFGFEAIVGDGNTLLLRFTPARGYYLYRDKTTFKLDAATIGAGIRVGRPRWPAGKAHRDEHFGDVVVFFDQIDVPLSLLRTQTDGRAITLTAGFQGCQTDGICYPPMTRTVALELPAGTLTTAAAAAAAPAATDTASPVAEGANPAAEPATTSTGTADAAATAIAPAVAADANTADANQAEDSRLAAALRGPDRVWALLGFFALGLALAFTPCVYPMIPILSGLIAGHGPGLGARRAFALSLVYVLTNALVLTAIGIVVGLLGANLQALFQKHWIIALFALLFVALALSSFGLYELQIPAPIRARLGALSDKQRSGSWLGVAAMGALSTLIVGPCVAPPLAGAVLVISQTHDPWLGGLALFLLGLGMGTPLLAFGVAVGKGMPTSGPWMVAVQRAFGLVFLGLAVWMLSRIAPGPVTLALWAALLLGGAVMIAMALTRTTAPMSMRAAGWTLVALMGIAGVAQAVGALAGSRDPLQPLAGLQGTRTERALPFRTIKSTQDLDRELAAARAAAKPLVLDFYADWCVACKEMEKYTFPEPAVHAALADFVLLKADVTANDAADQALLQRLGLIGPPATLFYVDGTEQRGLRLIGFEQADKFVERADRVKR